MPKIEIRPALSADIASLLQFEHDSMTDYVWQMNRIQDEGEVTVQFREIRLPRSVRVEYPYSPSASLEGKDHSGLLIASMDGQPVGYVDVSDSQAPQTGWVMGLVVARSARRQGIGSALMLAAQDWASRRRLRNAVLEISSKNFPAIRMATKLGFEFCGYNDHYYVNQDIALFFTRYLR